MKIVKRRYFLEQHQILKLLNIFIKNLDELMKNFLWDWEVFNDKYKVVSANVA